MMLQTVSEVNLEQEDMPLGVLQLQVAAKAWLQHSSANPSSLRVRPALPPVRSTTAYNSVLKISPEFGITADEHRLSKQIRHS